MQGTVLGALYELIFILKNNIAGALWERVLARRRGFHICHISKTGLREGSPTFFHGLHDARTSYRVVTEQLKEDMVSC